MSSDQFETEATAPVNPWGMESPFRGEKEFRSNGGTWLGANESGPAPGYEEETFDAEGFEPQAFTAEGFEPEPFTAEELESKRFVPGLFESFRESGEVGEDLYSAEPEEFDHEEFEPEQFEPEEFEPEEFEPEEFEPEESEPEYAPEKFASEEFEPEGLEPEELTHSLLESFGESDALDEDQFAPELEFSSGEEEAGPAAPTQSFPSGTVLSTVQGATGIRQEHWDPYQTGLPLLATGPSEHSKRLSTHFKVRELAASGGQVADRARISPELVRVLQAIRDRAQRPVRINSGYRSWARNQELYKARGQDAKKSRHCSGQAADITIAGLTGTQIAQLAIDAGGAGLGIGIGSNYAHVDVRGSWALWTYIGGSAGTQAMRTVTAYRNNRRSSSAQTNMSTVSTGSAASTPAPTRTPDRLAGLVRRPKVGACRGGEQPGARALADQWRRLTGRKAGTYNCRSVRGRPGVPSVHGEGRAIDIASNAQDAVQREQTDKYVAWLIANAVELQVVYVIWNRRQWGWPRRSEGWRPYTGQSPHKDHAHIELSWEGALHPSPLFSSGVPGPSQKGETAPESFIDLPAFIAKARKFDWSATPDMDRMRYVMTALVRNYGYPLNGAAGIVGNLWAESELIPNRVEGSRPRAPMTARDFSKALRTFTPDEIMNRSYQRKMGPAKPGIGLAQWTTPSRRQGLFAHRFRNRTPGAAILFDMDAQIDYFHTELRRLFPRVYAVVSAKEVSVEDAADEVVYSYERPGSILTKIGAKWTRLPRTDRNVQKVFTERRGHAYRALSAYM